MMRWWNRWVALLGRTEPGESLAVFRIACGACVLLTLGSMLGNGLVRAVWLDAAHGGYRTSLSGNWLIHLMGGVTPSAVWALVMVTTAAGAALVLGAGGRAAALVAGQGVFALTQLNDHASGGYDLMLTNALWLLVLSRSTTTLSLDCRLRHGTWARRIEVPAWPRYLVVLQLVAVYASTGIQKLSVHWTPAGGFSALYYILQQPDWQRFDMSWVSRIYPLTQIATAITWVWEITAPLVLLSLYTRATSERGGRLRAAFNRLNYLRCFVLIGVTMHLATWVLMDVGPFTWVTLAYYPCLWRPGGSLAHGRVGWGAARAMPSRKRATLLGTKTADS